MEEKERTVFVSDHPAGTSWQDGMVSGNGTIGVVCAGDPSSELLIFQNIHFIMPSDDPRRVPEEVGEQLQEARQSVLCMDDSWNIHGRKRTYHYAYHPGYRMRLSFAPLPFDNYHRQIDYMTAEISESFHNQFGIWKRSTFVSRKDNVIITRLRSSDLGVRINMTISIDDLSDLPRFGIRKNGIGPEINMRYKKTAAQDGSMISLMAHYPSYEESELKEGGYVGITRILTEGGNKRRIFVKREREEDIYVGGQAEPVVEIRDAETVWLITTLKRTHQFGKIEEFTEYSSDAFLKTVNRNLDEVIKKYYVRNGFDYDNALNEQRKIQSELFNRVSFQLGNANEERSLSNEELLCRQRSSKKLLKAAVERAWMQGRYAQICCAQESFPRLCGLWTGEWNPGWFAAYTMDANVNIQAAGMNTGNLKEAGIGYINFVVKQIPDWKRNAEKVYGMKNAIQVPVNTDGDRALMVEYDISYPFQYWNAGASWILLPIYEFWQCFGNCSVPIYDENRNIVQERDLETEILMPLLAMQANFWEQLCTPEYFMDKTGTPFYEAGKSELKPGERYLIIPSYSPENHPEGYGSTLTANAAMDIAAARDGLRMAIHIARVIEARERTGIWTKKIKDWGRLRTLLPEYLYDESGAIREWALNCYQENNRHRHISHLYCAWPSHEAQKDEWLKKACRIAIENRNRENKGIDDTASHGWIHKALVEARLGNADNVRDILYLLMSSKIYYNSFMTDHNTDRCRNVYCTDTSIGLTGIIQEMLLYSDSGTIRLLPALPQEWKRGSICGLMARSCAQVVRLEWDLEKGEIEVVIKSEKGQRIEIICGRSDYVSESEQEEEKNVYAFQIGQERLLRFQKMGKQKK